MRDLSIIKLSITFLILSSISFISSALSQGIDNIHVASTNNALQKAIRIYNGSGELEGDIFISDTFGEAQFVTGKWLPNGLSALALLDRGRQRISAIIINGAGEAVSEIDLGREVFRVIAINANGNDLTDLAVQRTQEGELKIYLDPGSSPNQVVETRTPNRTDIIQTHQGGIDAIGFIKREDRSNRKGKGKKNKKRRRGNKKGVQDYIEFTDIDGQTKRIKIPNKKFPILPVEINGSPAYAIAKGKKVQVFDANGRVLQERKGRNIEVISGHFTTAATTDILLADTNGNIQIIDTATGAKRNITIDINAAPKPVDEPSDSSENEGNDNSIEEDINAEQDAICQRINEVAIQIERALAEGNINRVIELQNELLALIAEANGRCENGGTPNNPSPSNPGGQNPSRPTFPFNGITYLTDTVEFKSNTGVFLGPCDRFLPARDGAQGFLAKNSESKGIVYLTPGANYTNGRILHPRTLKVTEQTRDSGVANGGRRHFRTGGLLPRGAHVFAADLSFSGETHCWRIPNGTTRVD